MNIDIEILDKVEKQKANKYPMKSFYLYKVEKILMQQELKILMLKNMVS